MATANVPQDKLFRTELVRLLRHLVTAAALPVVLFALIQDQIHITAMANTAAGIILLVKIIRRRKEVRQNAETTILSTSIAKYLLQEALVIVLQ